MGLILPQKVNVKLNSSVISYYEKLGYTIPRSKDKEGRLRVPQNTLLEVDVNDLSKGSNQRVNVECDCCKKEKRITYNKYNLNIERNNGLYICSSDTIHRDFKNNISVDSILDKIKEFYERNGRFPKTDEYTIENGFNFSYSIVRDRLRKENTTLNDELAKIDCFAISNANVKYYDIYFNKLKNVIYENPEIGNNLYLLSREDNCSKFGLPDIRWFINNCPDDTVINIDTFKKWAGLSTKHMSKEQCQKIILEMSKKLNRPLMYDDFRGHNYGQVTIQMIRDNWGSLNKMKEDLGLEKNIESMIDRQLSKESFDKMINNICDFVKNDNRNFITTREINAHKEWVNTETLRKTSKKYYNCTLIEIMKKHGISFGKQGRGINYVFDDGEQITSQFEYMFSNFLKECGLKYNCDYFRDVKYSTFINDYHDNMNCDYVIHHKGIIIYIEIAGILSEYKKWYYQNRKITKSKHKEKYRQKLSIKESMLKSNNLIYFILFPCDLTRENFESILNNPSIELRKQIEQFNQNNIDWVKIRNTTGELDYSKPYLKNTYKKKRIS